MLPQGDLCACTLRFTMPLQLVSGGVESAAGLAVSLALGDPVPCGGLSHEQLALELRCSLGSIHSHGYRG